MKDVFERKEKKYILTREQYDRFTAATDGILQTDDYGISRIASLYYDTPENSLICRSLEKPKYKEKLRVRAYGQVGPDDRVFVELKKKFKGIVYKRRVATSLRNANAWLAGGSFVPFEGEATYQERQISAEIDAFMQRHDFPTPAMTIEVDRYAQYSTDGSDVRVTFDLNPRWRSDVVDLDVVAPCNPILEQGKVIMEVKCLGAYPLWLTRVLSDLRIYPESCSKYGRAYQLSMGQVPVSAAAFATEPTPEAVVDTEPDRPAIRILYPAAQRRGAHCA